MSFDRICQWTLAAEGGAAITDDPRDPGGLTKYGIAQRSHPGVDIRALDLAGAEAIYQREYWDANHCGDLPDVVAMVVFDSAVNLGDGREDRFLQSACGVTVDGQIGPATLAAANAADPVTLACACMAEREAFYKASPLTQYHNGWLNRCDALRAFLGLPAAE